MLTSPLTTPQEDSIKFTLLFADVYKGVSDLVARVQTLHRAFKHIVLISEMPQIPPGKTKKV